MTTVTGTFSGTGASDAIDCPPAGAVNIGINFGAGSVTVQQRIAGTWYDVEALTSDAVRVFESPVGCDVRLNCTSHSSDISYSMDNT